MKVDDIPKHDCAIVEHDPHESNLRDGKTTGLWHRHSGSDHLIHRGNFDHMMAEAGSLSLAYGIPIYTILMPRDKSKECRNGKLD